MRKSKYLILSPLYFKFNNNLTEINSIKKLFDTQNILDLLRFDKLLNHKECYLFAKIMHLSYHLDTSDAYLYSKEIINFCYFPNSIEIIPKSQFQYNEIKYINFSNCKNLKAIYGRTFFNNSIKILDLSNCKKLNTISDLAFAKNNISKLKLPNSIQEIGISAFEKNNINYLNLSNCRKLKYLENHTFMDNQIKNIKFSNNIKEIKNKAFYENKIEYLDLSNCKKLKLILLEAFNNNPLNEIKILDNITLEDCEHTNENPEYLFTFVYQKNNKNAGTYKFNKTDNKWKWYPL